MTPLEFLSSFLKHCAAAAVALVVLLFAAERLAPGSVLAFVNVYWSAAGAVGLVILSTLVRWSSYE